MKSACLYAALLLTTACRQAPEPVADSRPANAAPATRAGPEAATALPQSRIDFCSTYSKLAGAIMEGHQNGADMAGAMALAKGDPQIQGLVVAAYDLPRFSTERNQKRQTTDFANQAYMACLKSGTQG